MLVVVIDPYCSISRVTKSNVVSRYCTQYSSWVSPALDRRLSSKSEKPASRNTFVMIWKADMDWKMQQSVMRVSSQIQGRISIR